MKSYLAFVSCTLLGLAAALSAKAPTPDGATLFQTRCQACHSVTAGHASPLAPNLAGVVGRQAGSASFGYSPTLEASKLIWSRENLDRFLSGPGRMVPGTRMVVIVTDPAERAAIVNFLGRNGR